MAETMDYMGTLGDAQAKCLDTWKRWCVYRQPHIGTAAEHRKRDAEAAEAQNQFANASALLCWHLERATVLPEPSVVDDLAVSLKHAVKIIQDHVPLDALGMNAQGDPDVPGGYEEWSLLSEYLHNMEAALTRAGHASGLTNTADTGEQG